MKEVDKLRSKMRKLLQLLKLEEMTWAVGHCCLEPFKKVKVLWENYGLILPKKGEIKSPWIWFLCFLLNSFIMNSIRPVMMILKELMEDLNHQGPTIHQSTPGNICLWVTVVSN